MYKFEFILSSLAMCVYQMCILFALDLAPFCVSLSSVALFMLYFALSSCLLFLIIFANFWKVLGRDTEELQKTVLG